jgi:hypothetical protein
MMIKTDQFELEIVKGSSIYLGSKRAGQTFYEWNEIDDNMKIGLDNIMKQVQSLIQDSENLLSIESQA